MSLKLPKGAPRIGDLGRLSESRLAKSLGGTARPASGAMQGAKGDIAFPAFLMEAKATENRTMSLKHDWLAKIASEASLQGKHPALAISFIDGNGRGIPKGEWVCIPLSLFREKFLEGE